MFVYLNTKYLIHTYLKLVYIIQLNLMKSVITLIIVLLFTTVDSQVLGIDFGTEFWKAALISPGKNLVIV